MSHQPPRVFESITQEPLLALFPRGFALPCCSKLSLLAHLLPSCLVMSHRGQMDRQGPPRTGWAGPSYPWVPCGLRCPPSGKPLFHHTEPRQAHPDHSTPPPWDTIQVRCRLHQHSDVFSYDGTLGRRIHSENFISGLCNPEAGRS